MTSCVFANFIPQESVYADYGLSPEQLATLSCLEITENQRRTRLYSMQAVSALFYRLNPAALEATASSDSATTGA